MQIQTLVEAFKTDYLDHPRRTFQTYDKDYGQIYRKLPPDEPISVELLTQCLTGIPDNTRQRKRAAHALAKLGQFAGLQVDFTRLSGTYSRTKTQRRILPSDETIATFHQTIQNSKWRWVHGAIATYGLRPHEAFFLRINADGTADVLQGKTGPRQVWPYLPEWVYDFGLQSKRLPDVTTEGRPFERIGRNVCDYLRRHAHAPYKIYDLRHAWAIRVMDLGLKNVLAADQMGHTLDVHQLIYQKWITEREHQAAFQEILKNRPPRR
jgi:hypothetical protein